MFIDNIIIVICNVILFLKGIKRILNNILCMMSFLWNDDGKMDFYPASFSGTGKLFMKFKI